MLRQLDRSGFVMTTAGHATRRPIAVNDLTFIDAWIWIYGKKNEKNRDFAYIFFLQFSEFTSISLPNIHKLIMIF